MRNKESYIRYRLIDKRLRMKPEPTLQELVNYVSDKTQCSVRTSTIQKDLYAMRSDKLLAFNAPIEYDKAINAYSYSNSEFTIDHQVLLHRIKILNLKLNGRP